MRRIATALVLVLVVLGASDASAQTRFSVEAGPLVPFGDFSDGVDGSAWIGARGEFQGVNALGQVAKLSFVVQTGYADLELADGAEGDASLFAVGAGVRVYSVALPFFLHGGVEYISTDYESGDPLVDASSNTFGPTLGGGFLFDFGAVFVEVEARLHMGLGAGDDEIDPRFTTFTAALGLPF